MRDTSRIVKIIEPTMMLILMIITHLLLPIREARMVEWIPRILLLAATFLPSLKIMSMINVFEVLCSHQVFLIPNVSPADHHHVLLLHHQGLHLYLPPAQPGPRAATPPGNGAADNQCTAGSRPLESYFTLIRANSLKLLLLTFTYTSNK